MVLDAMKAEVRPGVNPVSWMKSAPA